MQEKSGECGQFCENYCTCLDLNSLAVHAQLPTIANDHYKLTIWYGNGRYQLPRRSLQGGSGHGYTRGLMGLSWLLSPVLMCMHNSSRRFSKDKISEVTCWCISDRIWHKGSLFASSNRNAHTGSGRSVKLSPRVARLKNHLNMWGC